MNGLRGPGLITAAFLGSLLCAGCSGDRGSMMSYSLGRKSGHPQLILEGTAIRFEGVAAPGPDADRLAGGVFMVAGPGSSRGKFGADGIEVEHSQAQGACTVSVGGQRFQVLEAGRKLRFGEKDFVLPVAPRTIVVAADGSARLLE